MYNLKLFTKIIMKLTNSPNPQWKQQIKERNLLLLQRWVFHDSKQTLKLTDEQT